MLQVRERATLLPVPGCFVSHLENGDVGLVRQQREGRNGPEVEVAWAAARTTFWIPCHRLGCGFREGMWVDLAPGRPGSHPEIGQILQFREIGGQTQALVEFVESGLRCWLPFQLLRRQADIRERLVRGQLGELPHGAERFRLRCLAHGLEIWNENTGALSGLNIEPLPHQVSLVHHILASGHFNWLIADDVGLGKTIEVGMLLHAYLLREPDARVLIVCPAGLTQQWQEELRFKFGFTDFEIYGEDFQIPYADMWFKKNRVIGSMDRLKHPNHLSKLQEVRHWDLVIFDEAHRLSRHERGNRYSASERFALAQELRATTDSLLLLTATPHQGKDDLFRAILGLLRPDWKKQIHLLEHHREILHEMVIRNPKAEVRDWEGNKIFKGKEVRAVRVSSPRGLLDFTALLQSYFRQGYERASQMGHKGQAISFVMTVYRKLAASSIAAIVTALERRLQRLEAGEIGTDFEAPGEEADLRYRGEQEEAAAQGAGSFFSGEREKLAELIRIGRAMLPSDPKLAELLHKILPSIRQKARTEKVVLFTEYRSTQNYLEKQLRGHFGASSVVLIHGSMNMAERRESIRRFEEQADFLISTEAGGEGINLQKRCHTMINYDIPWNPTRLVQRVGRLYRYGQDHPVVVFNLFSDETLDSQIVAQIHQRIENIVGDLGVLGGDFTDSYGDEVLGQIAELCEVEPIFDHAYSRQVQNLEVEITEALEKARQIYEERKDLFSYFAQTLDPNEGKGELLMSTEHLMQFVHGMCDLLEISVEEQSADGNRLTLKPPEHLLERLQLGRRQQLRISFARGDSGDSKWEVMDWNSPFLQTLLKEALSRDFGGEVACIDGLPHSGLVVATLYWQNSRGKRYRRELCLAWLNAQGELDIHPESLREYLLESLEDGNLPPKEQRKLAFDKVAQGLQGRLAEVSHAHLHPEAIGYLALAIRGE